MKAINGLVYLAIAGACTGCATPSPRTVSALPDPPSAVQVLQPLMKTPSGDYIGYQRIVVDGQQRYCRQNLTKNPQTESRVVCITEAQLRTEHLLAQERAQLRQTQLLQGASRPPTPNREAQQASMQLMQNAANIPGPYTTGMR